MSEFKGTPGPWFAVENCCFWEIRTSEFEYGGEQIGDACASGFIDGMKDNPVEIANARLIAAAPELLEASKWAANYIDTIVDPNALKVLESLRTSIAKALGE